MDEQTNYRLDVNYKDGRVIGFNVPTQVRFWDIDGDHYTGGIGVDNHIICGCCGGYVDIDEIYEFAPEDVNPIEVLTWIDISNEIKGD